MEEPSRCGPSKRSPRRSSNWWGHMPFVKRDVTAPGSTGRRAGDDLAPHDDGLASHIAALGSPDIEVRWSAARALGGRADAVPALAAALGVEQVARVREAIMTFMAPLLADSDSDVRLLATELARNMPAENATQLLCRLLEHEQHPNVC